MSGDPFQRLQGESATAYAGRFRDLIGDIVGTVQCEPGLFIYTDEVLADLEWIIAQPRHEEQILAYAEEMAR